jgi:hypothetical protein
MDFLGKIFGNSLSGVAQTIVEPMVNSLLSGIGLEGYFKDFLVSFITSNPTRLATALKSCDELTKLVAAALSEAVFMMIQRQQGLEGQGYTFLRNALGGAVKDYKFVESLEYKDFKIELNKIRNNYRNEYYKNFSINNNLNYKKYCNEIDYNESCLILKISYNI